MASYEVLEHTADVGIRARGETLEDLFAQAARGLCDINGTWREGPGRVQTVHVEAADLGALLVYWLEEVLYLHEARDSVVTSIAVDRVTENDAAGAVGLAPRGDVDLEGTAVKAITYHQLHVGKDADGWVAVVYLDI